MDVRNEKVSLEAARKDYGVILDPARWEVDTAATTSLRQQMREARGWKEVPKVLREEPGL